MPRQFLLLFFILLLPVFLNAQAYSGGRHTRHRFAQGTFGFDLQYIGPVGSFIVNGQEPPVAFETSGRMLPRLFIGGTHFWGHVEFFFTISTGNLLLAKSSGLKTQMRQDDIFGVKIYPWAVQAGRLRPYFGAAPSLMLYRQANGGEQGPDLQLLKAPLMAGVLWTKRGKYRYHLFDIGLNWLGKSRHGYYIDRQRQMPVTFPSLAVQAGWRMMLETTAASEKRWQDSTTMRRTKVLGEKGRLNSFYLAAGPSSAFWLGQRHSSYNRQLRPYLGGHTVSVFPEFGIGYQHFRAKAFAGLAFRSIRSELKAYGTRQVLRRTAFTLEAARYLFDYHGFTPYAGLNLSCDLLSAKENDEGSETLSRRSTQFHPGLTVGWDILPDQLQWFVLRTTLRWSPLAEMPAGAEYRFSYRQLEFNFIQLVWYPSRRKSIQETP